MKINVSGLSLNYVKLGDGPHPVILLPGSFGTIEKDFELQLKGLDKEKFTIVSWDPPGYGQSRPPSREFEDEKMLNKDADLVAQLMETLGFKKYSIIGFCAGGATGLILAANYPDRVLSMAIWGARSFIDDKDKEVMKKFMSGEFEANSANDLNYAIYGEEECKRMYKSLGIALMKKENICRNELPKIECPVLILHGEKDNYIRREHPEYLAANIKKTKLHFFPEGKHFIHRKYAQEFNEIVEKFILQPICENNNI